MADDYEIAFGMQMMEATAASMGVDSVEAAAAMESNPEPLGAHSMELLDQNWVEALKVQWSEIQRWQQEETDRKAAQRESRVESRRLRQLEHDRRLAQALSTGASVRDDPLPDEFDEVDEEYWIKYLRKFDSAAKRSTPSVSVGNGCKIPMESCLICMEDRLSSEMLTLSACSHRFCSDCVAQHAEMKVKEGQVSIGCPEVDCKKAFTAAECSKLLTKKSSDLLAKRIIDLSIPEQHKVYCPYKNCSEVMDRRKLQPSNSQASSSSSSLSAMGCCVQCFNCDMFFCLDCKVPWHEDMSCETYQALPAELRDVEGAKLYKLAKAQKWMQCSKCGCMIELVSGCNHMQCRCGYQFCYQCGANWHETHRKCACAFWEEDKMESCRICMEDRLPSKMLTLTACSHRFCWGCVAQHAETKVKEGHASIRCLEVDCKGALTSDECNKLLSETSSELLAKRLIDLSIPVKHKVYCPYKNCSQLMDGRKLQPSKSQARFSSSPSSASRSAMARRVQCFNCEQLFCLGCKVPWHENMSCNTYQNLPAELRDVEGAKLHKLAKAQKWMRCSKCGRMIELVSGCKHVRCRCGHQFCYSCGANWGEAHRSTSCTTRS